MGEWQKAKPDPTSVGLPPRAFLYTLDQIALMIEMDLKMMRARHVYFDGRSVGRVPRDKLLARNLNGPGETPDWRVAENELTRWLKVKGFRFHTRGWLTH